MRACVYRVPLPLAPPFSELDLQPFPCHPLGFLPSNYSYLPLPASVALTSASFPFLPLLAAQSLTVIVLFIPLSHVHPHLPPCVPRCLLVSSGDYFLLRVSVCAIVRGQGASTSWRSLTQALAPTLLGHAGAIWDTPPDPVPPPLCTCDLIPVGWSLGGVELEVRCTHASRSHGRG